MPTLGPVPAEIAIIYDFPDGSRTDGGFIPAFLSRLGIVSTSCFQATITETRPPKDDIDEWLSSRKTCPGVGWVYKGDKWLHPTLAEGWASLERKLAEVAPKLVIACGKAPLVCLTGQDAIAKWRGSRLTPEGLPFTVVPTLHPRTLISQPEQRFILEMDLRRAYNIYTQKQIPRGYRFTIAPSLDEVVGRLNALHELADLYLGTDNLLKLSGDLETRQGHIACFGIAWSAEEAICIPHLVTAEESPFYWSIEDESLIIWHYAQLFLHPNILWVGQNYLYDAQYFHRHWGIIPRKVRDTMIAHHSLYSNIRKGLDFLSSMYAHDHVYWKEDIRDWNPKLGEKQYWEYNCKDCCITWEIDEAIVEAGKERL